MNSSKYFNDLIQIARDRMPSLEYSIQNGSTVLALRECVSDLYKIVGIMLHHQIQETAERLSAGQKPIAPAPAPAVVPVIRPAPPRPVSPSGTLEALIESLPPPPGSASSQSSSASLPIPGMPNVDIQPGVTNVTITSTGTHVVSPTGTRTVLPPNTPVDLAASAPELPPAPPGVEQVVLPPGGRMSPELEAALAGRSNDQPPQ